MSSFRSTTTMFSRKMCMILAVSLLCLIQVHAWIPSRMTSSVVAGASSSFTQGPRLWPVSARKTAAEEQEVSTFTPLTAPQVRAMFDQWNRALASGKGGQVARLYHDDAMLLPTISDTPRTNFREIKAYFDMWLKRKPQGVILDSTITMGANFCQDCGIYEFTMGDDGSVVKARYTFVYTPVNPLTGRGPWKIAHQHSSIMPESIVVGETITVGQVRSLFYLWNDALQTLDSKAVTDRYAQNAILLPTVSDLPRSTPEAIQAYFDDFLLKKPRGTIVESNVLIGTNWCQDAGVYEFFMAADGSRVQARYSFVYVFEDGQWKIAHHHSSVMPEALLKRDASKPAVPEMNKVEVRQLFKQWNDALATGSAEKVVKRYAKDAVLLPTVSDTPRTTRAAIKDYFVTFLKKKPQGIILEGDVYIGNGYCQDAGIYKFTMGADQGAEVLARYTFVYVYEDGEWKISHHHSSVLPESMLEKMGGNFNNNNDNNQEFQTRRDVIVMR